MCREPSPRCVIIPRSFPSCAAAFSSPARLGAGFEERLALACDVAV